MYAKTVEIKRAYDEKMKNLFVAPANPAFSLHAIASIEQTRFDKWLEEYRLNFTDGGYNDFHGNSTIVQVIEE